MLKGVLITFAMAHPGLAVPAVEECGFKQVTERIYVIVGADHATCPKKYVEHPLTNPAVIVGESGVIVVDPGGSLQVGRLLLQRVAAVTDKPVVAVFNTHIHGLYWLGNQAVKEKYPGAQIYAHERMVERIQTGEGQFWVDAMTGKYDGEKTQYVIPDVRLGGNEALSIAGMTIKLHHTGHAHTDHDLMIEVPEDKAVFLGGIVVEPEVPSQGVPQDADFKGQISATRYAIGLGAEYYIPGRGEPGGVELPQRGLRFLTALYDRVGDYYDDGLQDFEIAEKVRSDLSDYEQWYDFALLGRVISHLYLQVESERF
jgi:glyoxylase-like metal-dependent hydrolase (beta-lactamase superfamily II)